MNVTVIIMFFLLWVDSQKFCKMKLYKEYKHIYTQWNLRTRDALGRFGGQILSLVEKFRKVKYGGETSVLCREGVLSQRLP